MSGQRQGRLSQKTTGDTSGQSSFGIAYPAFALLEPGGNSPLGSKAKFKNAGESQ